MAQKVQLKKINCSNCGAELIYDPGTQMTNCSFCGSKFEIESATDEEFVLPDGIVPFLVSQDEFHQAVTMWLSEGDYTPEDILTSSDFAQISGVYLPMYYFTGKYHGNWSASSGYKKKVEFTEWSESKKKMVKKTKTVTEWRPSSGQSSGRFSSLCFAGAGQGVPLEMALHAQDGKINRAELKSYDTQYTLGFNLLNFTTDREDRWYNCGEPQADSISNADIKRRIPGDTFKDLTSDVLYDREEAINLYVPYWIGYYNYAGKDFQVFMDGRSTIRIGGERPVDESLKSKANEYFNFVRYWKYAVYVWIMWGAFSLSLADDPAGWIEHHWHGEDGGWWYFRFILAFGGWIIIYFIAKNKKEKVINAAKERRQRDLISMHKE